MQTNSIKTLTINLLRLMMALMLLVGMFGFLHIDAVHAAGGTVRYVETSGVSSGDCDSWANSCDLQYALGLAVSGDELWVKQGIYVPGTLRTDTFALKNGVGIYGGFAGTETLVTERDPKVNVTVLSGDIGVSPDANDNSYHVVTGNGTDSSAVLDGFTITAGNADGSDPDFYGGGMYNESGSPTLSNLIFSGNTAAVYGGGMFNKTNSSPSVTNATFSSNSAVRGGGMYNIDNSNATLMDVTFSGNVASNRGGGMVVSDSTPSLTNVTFSGNTAQWGGGLHNAFNGNPTLTNVTFSGNTATNNGGGIYNHDNSNPIITNSILYGDSAVNEIYNDLSVAVSTPVVTYSIVAGGYAGIGNLDVDPLLGPLQDNGGFTQTMALGTGSLAIDAGDDTNCPETDQRGVTRPQRSQCDMGAYEYEPVATVELTVTADDQTITYGDVDPTFTFTYSGFQGGDDETDIETPPTCSVSGVYSDAGIYTISCAGAVDSHGVYVFNYVDGDLTINKATPTLSVSNSPVPYTGSAQTADVSSDSVAGTVSDVQYDGSATAPVNAGTYAITADFTPEDTTNYISLTDASAGDFVINKATPTLSVSNSPVPYTGSAQTADVSSGSVAGTVSNIRYDGSATAPVDAGTYAVTADFTPDDTTNYISLTDASAGDFVIESGLTITLQSVGAQDGWILESSETSNKGGKLNKTATTLRLGDDAANRQYRSILSFDTSTLPEGTQITSVTLKFKYAGKSGTDPFTKYGNLLVDICMGAFKGNSALQLGDFKPTPTCGKNQALIYTNTKVDNWYSQSLNPDDFGLINLDGVTQFRLRFSKDDNNDFGADFLKLYSGNAAEADRPQLIIEYYVP